MSSTGLSDEEQEAAIKFGRPHSFGMTEEELRERFSRVPPRLHFWNDLELNDLRAIWRRAGAVEREHTADHLRFDMPKGGVVTVTREAITAPRADLAAIRASIEAAERLWCGGHVTGNRDGQLLAAAFGQMLGVKVTTAEQFHPAAINNAVRQLRQWEQTQQAERDDGPTRPKGRPVADFTVNGAGVATPAAA